MASKAPLDPLDKLFANAWRRFAARFWTLAWIFVAPAALLVAGSLLSGRPASSTAAAVAGGSFSFLGTVLSIMASLALINALARGTDFAASYRVGAKLFWAAVWISILNVLAALGGFILLIVPGIVIAVMLMFVNYALVVEDARGMRALAQSRAYVRGYWWPVFGRSVLIAAIFLVVMAAVYAPALNLLGDAAGGVVYFALLVCYTAFGTSYSFEIYENLRRVKAGGPSASAEGAEGRAAKAGPDFLKICIMLGVVAAIVILIAVAAGAGGAFWRG